MANPSHTNRLLSTASDSPGSPTQFQTINPVSAQQSCIVEQQQQHHQHNHHHQQQQQQPNSLFDANANGSNSNSNSSNQRWMLDCAQQSGYDFGSATTDDPSSVDHHLHPTGHQKRPWTDDHSIEAVTSKKMCFGGVSVDGAADAVVGNDVLHHHHHQQQQQQHEQLMQHAFGADASGMSGVDDGQSFADVLHSLSSVSSSGQVTALQHNANSNSNASLNFDDDINQHVQNAIDSILNLQQNDGDASMHFPLDPAMASFLADTGTTATPTLSSGNPTSNSCSSNSSLNSVSSNSCDEADGLLQTMNMTTVMQMQHLQQDLVQQQQTQHHHQQQMQHQQHGHLSMHSELPLHMQQHILQQQLNMMQQQQQQPMQMHQQQHDGKQRSMHGDCLIGGAPIGGGPIGGSSNGAQPLMADSPGSAVSAMTGSAGGVGPSLNGVVGGGGNASGIDFNIAGGIDEAIKSIITS